jgi:uncharacterized protein YndB with AHSA1/START domain
VPTPTDVLTQEVRIDASPETVFQFFTDPSRMVRWKGRAATLDPRPGGIYRVEINDQATALGEYVELDPPRRVVITWGWEGATAVPPGSSTVEFELEPDGDGTIVRLTHRGLPPDEVEIHGQGWGNYLPRLAVAAAGGDPGPDPLGVPHT